MSRLFVFETTHHALWAEQVTLEQGLAAQVVPAPKEAESKCGLALETLPEQEQAVAALLRETGVEYRIYPED